MIIDTISPYNGILGRPWIGKIEVITSFMHLKTRYPIHGGGIGQNNNEQAMARRCSAQGLKNSKEAQFISISQANQKEAEQAEKRARFIFVSQANLKGT